MSCLKLAFPAENRFKPLERITDTVAINKMTRAIKAKTREKPLCFLPWFRFRRTRARTLIVSTLFMSQSASYYARGSRFPSRDSAESAVPRSS